MLRGIGYLQQPLLGIAEHTLGRFKKQPKPITDAQGFDPISPTSKSDLDQILLHLQSKSQAWAQTSPLQRAQLLRSCLETTIDVAEEAATAAAKCKGSFGFGIGEELLSFIPIISGIREYAESLEASGAPRPANIRRHPITNQWVAEVFPTGLQSLLFGGFLGEQWIEPGKEPTQGALYRTAGTAGTQSSISPKTAGGVSLVLGAGNQTPVVALDIFHVLTVENCVIICKMNPVNEYMGPYLRRAFFPLVEAGFLEFVYGGGKEGAYLCNHDIVKSVHLTGSQYTYDAIVWGITTPPPPTTTTTITTTTTTTPTPTKHALDSNSEEQDTSNNLAQKEREKRKEKSGSPLLKKPVSAELGCVTPYIIVPGTWSASDIDYHAESVVTGLTQNAGHNCLKAEIIVTDKDWPQRELFLQAVRKKLAATPNRIAYYPGSGHKAASFKRKFPDAEEIGNNGTGGTVIASDGSLHANASSIPTPIPRTSKEQHQQHIDIRQLPWFLKTGLSPNEAATKDENWCGVLQEVALPGSHGNVDAFLSSAVDFANTRCWGTLSCAVFIHPSTQKKHKAAFNKSLVDLKYGTICINVPGSVGFAVTKLAWGAYPGSTPADIGSGNCKVHNTMLFDHVEKSVLQGPWRFHPYPFWLTSHRNQEEVAKLSMKFMADPSLRRMLPLIPQALLG